VIATAVALLTTMFVWSFSDGAAAGRRDAGMQPAPKIKEAPAVRMASFEGKDTFAAYCAVCHGADGKGHGPAAAALAKPVPDLTQLASRQGGKFNLLAAEATITARDRIPRVDLPFVAICLLVIGVSLVAKPWLTRTA
jgi:mono/diheme cytochrome c family protein